MYLMYTCINTEEGKGFSWNTSGKFKFKLRLMCCFFIEVLCESAIESSFWKKKRFNLSWLIDLIWLWSPSSYDDGGPLALSCLFLRRWVLTVLLFWAHGMPTCKVVLCSLVPCVKVNTKDEKIFFHEVLPSFMGVSSVTLSKCQLTNELLYLELCEVLLF